MKILVLGSSRFGNSPKRRSDTTSVGRSVYVGLNKTRSNAFVETHCVVLLCALCGASCGHLIITGLLQVRLAPFSSRTQRAQAKAEERVIGWFRVRVGRSSNGSGPVRALEQVAEQAAEQAAELAAELAAGGGRNSSGAQVTVTTLAHARQAGLAAMCAAR